MTTPDDDPTSTSGRLRRLAGAPFRTAEISAEIEALRDQVLAVNHLVSLIDAWRTSVDDQLGHLRGVTLGLNHEVRRRDEAHDEALIESVVERHTAPLAGRIEALFRAVDAPRRDRAYEQVVSTIEPSTELVPGLSVLIAAWNHETRLGAAIDTACAVAGPEHVIVFDDASTDGTAKLLDDRDEPIRVIRAAENLGLTRARNALLRAVTTRHAVFLDADNRLDPDVFADLHQMAETWHAAVVHPTLLEVDGDDAAVRVLGATPMNADFFALTHNLVDTLSVIDVAAVRAVGGYTLEPGLETAEDWDMWHRLASNGGLLVHAPVIGGRKLRVGSGHNSQPQDVLAHFRTIERTYRFDGRLNNRTVASAVIHPDLGPLWASHAAVELHPSLADTLPEIDHDAYLPAAPRSAPLPQSILVVAAGGVHNLGDDATSIETVRRIAATAGSDIAIEVITDGPDPLPGLSPGLWLGTLADYAHRPLTHHVAVVLSGGGTMTDEFAQAVHDRLAVSDQAARAGVPLIATGQGVGPLTTLAPEARKIFGRATAVSCRDAESAELVRSFGCPDVTVIGDDAVRATEPLAVALPPVLADLPDRGWVTFNARLAGYSGAARSDIDQWADAVDAAANDLGLPVVAVAINDQPPDEVSLLSDVAGAIRSAPWLVVNCTSDVEQARATFGLAFGGVAWSYHACLFSLVGDAPALFPTASGYYAAKSAGLANHGGLASAFADSTPPSNGAELIDRWQQVRERLDADALRSSDATAGSWLERHLTSLVETTP